MIEQLVEEALGAIEDCGVEDLTAGEVLSVCYSMTKKVSAIMLQVEDEKDRRRYTDMIINGVGELYSLVPEQVVH